jgi:hypothetical protein
MNKQIIFLLLVITSTICHGMELTPNTTEALSHFTKHLCAAHNYNPHSLKNDIRALSDTNRSFHDYYAQEATQQEIIKQCAYQLYSNADHNVKYDGNDKDVATHLQCRTIKAKINRFINIAKDKNLEFSEDDLKDTWYLTLTASRSTEVPSVITYKKDISLLGIALHRSNYKAAHLILDNVQQLDFYYGDLYELHYMDLENEHAVAKKIISKRSPIIDNTDKFHGYTALLNAVEYNKRKLTRFLLEIGINPHTWPSNMRHVFYTEGYDYSVYPKTTQVPRTWFLEMFAEVENDRMKLWVLQNYQPDGYPIIPREVAFLILNLITTLKEMC